MKILICGSMTFSKKMIELEKELIKLGHSVLLPKFAEEYAKLESTEQMHLESARNKIKHDLIREHYNYINQSEAILIINVSRHDIDNYIGGNTFLEMGFAHILNKKIFLLNPLPKIIYTDEIEAMQPIVINGDLNQIK